MNANTMCMSVLTLCLTVELFSLMADEQLSFRNGGVRQESTRTKLLTAGIYAMLAQGRPSHG